MKTIISIILLILATFGGKLFAYPLSPADSALFFNAQSEFNSVKFEQVAQQLSDSCDCDGLKACEKFYRLGLWYFDYTKDDVSFAQVSKAFAETYCVYGENDSSLAYHKLALQKFEQLYKEDPAYFGRDVIAQNFSVGRGYYQIKNYQASEKHLKKSLEIFETLPDKNDEKYRDALAYTQFILAQDYINIENSDSALKYFEAALKNYEVLFEQDSAEYRNYLQINQSMVGLLYEGRKDYEQSLKYQKASLANLEVIYKNNPEKNREELASELNNLAYAYAKLDSLENSFKVIDKAIAAMPAGAYLYDSKGEFYLMQGKVHEALDFWERTLKADPDFLQKHPKGTKLYNGLKKMGLI